MSASAMQGGHNNSFNLERAAYQTRLDVGTALEI